MSEQLASFDSTHEEAKKAVAKGDTKSAVALEGRAHDFREKVKELAKIPSKGARRRRSRGGKGY